MSFKTKSEFAARPPTIVVQHPTTENYYDLLVTQRFYRQGHQFADRRHHRGDDLPSSVGTLAAYALSRFRLPRNFNYHLLFTMLTVRMFPPIVTVIPTLRLLQSRDSSAIKLLDTHIGLGLIHGFMELPLVLWMMIGFFRDIPRDMEEAALVDGDSRFAVLRKIAIPLAAPGLAATFILVFISSWNEFLLALILTRIEGADAADRGGGADRAVRRQVRQHDGRRGHHHGAGADPGAADAALSDARSGGRWGDGMIGLARIGAQRRALGAGLVRAGRQALRRRDRRRRPRASTSPNGEMLVLLGPSGCGKTTSLRMLAGLESISDGTIRIGETVVNNLPPRARDIAMVFQSYALYSHLTVYENLAYPLRVRKLPKAEIDQPRARRGRRWCRSASCSSASRASSPAASGSGWRWAGPSSGGRPSSSWTSRSRTSTPSCGCTRAAS